MFTLRTSCLALAMAFSLAACNPAAEKPAASAASGSAAASGASAAPAGGELKVIIGAANPLTGPYAHWGKDAANGIQLALNEANAENITWNGQKVTFELMSEDDQADPKTATQVADRFVDKKVAAVLGHLTSGAAIPASKTYSDNNIPEVAYSVTSPTFTSNGYKNVFRVIANDAQQGMALADFAVKKQAVKNFAIVHDKSAYGEGLANDFAKAAEAAGAKKVDTQYTTTSATEFGAIVTALKASKPDLIFYGGMDAQAAPLVRELRRQGVTAKFMGADGVQTSEFPKLAKDAAEGVFASTAGASKEKMPGYAKFEEAYKKAYNQDVVAYAPYAYDATNVVLAAMKKAQSADPAKYLPELAKTSLDGVTGRIEFAENGDIKNGTVTVYELKGGKWQEVK